MTKDKKEIRNLRIFAVVITILLGMGIYITYKYPNTTNKFINQFHRGAYGR
jgi:hypothetical protein